MALPASTSVPSQPRLVSQNASKGDHPQMNELAVATRVSYSCLSLEDAAENCHVVGTLLGLLKGPSGSSELVTAADDLDKL